MRLENANYVRGLLDEIHGANAQHNNNNNNNVRPANRDRNNNSDNDPTPPPTTENHEIEDREIEEFVERLAANPRALLRLRQALRNLGDF